MNNIFRLVWNRTLGRLVVTSEAARSRSKSSVTEIEVGVTPVVVPWSVKCCVPPSSSWLPRLAFIVSAVAATSGSLTAQAFELNGGDDCNGNASRHAIGQGSTACAAFAIAFGSNANASAADTIAIGRGSQATLEGGVAIGAQATYEAINGIAIGSGATASTGGVFAHIRQDANGVLEATIDGVGNPAMAIGGGANAAFGASALGPNSTASGGNSMAFGGQSKATEASALAFGPAAYATGLRSTAIGYQSAAAATYSMAFGPASTATGEYSLAFGASASASGEGALAIGSFSNNAQELVDNTQAKGDDSIAFGTSAQATRISALAIGTRSFSDGLSALAIGEDAEATANNAIAIGGDAIARDIVVSVDALDGASNPNGYTLGDDLPTTAVGAGSQAIAGTAIGHDAVAGQDIGATTNTGTAIGAGAQAIGNVSIAISPAAYAPAIAAGRGAIAQGFDARASGNDTIAIGSLAEASAENAIAMGIDAEASATNAIAMGKGAIASGAQSISIGFENEVSGVGSGAIGDPNIITGTGSYALGNDNTIDADNAGAFGNDNTLTAAADGSRVVGNTNTVSSIDALALGNRNTASGEGAVVIGRDSIASGLQSFAAGDQAEATGQDALAIGTASDSLGLSSTAFGRGAWALDDYSAAFGAETTATGIQSTAIGSFSEATLDQSVALGSGSIADTAAGINGYIPFGATAADTTAINNTIATRAAVDVGSRQITSVAAGTEDDDAVNVSQLIAAQSDVAAGTNIADVTASENPDGGTIYTVNANGASVSAGDGVDVTPAGPDANNVTDYEVALNQATKDSLTLADTSLQEVVTQVDGTDVKTLTKGDNNANFVSGKNIALSDDGADGIEVATLDNVIFTDVQTNTLTAGPVSIDAAGMDAGNTTISNVADGVNPQDAVNLSQLDTAAAASKTEVTGGTNIASVNKTTGADGQDIYEIDADGASVSAGDGVDVTPAGPDANNVTDYEVALNQATKDSLTLADTSLQEVITQVDGVDVKTIDQNDNVANFISGQNIELSDDGGAIEIATSADLIADSLTINNGPTLNDNGIDMGGDTITNLGDPVNGGDAVNLDYFDENRTRYYSVNDNGTIQGNYDNDGATGVNALAAGTNATAASDNSVAMGNGATTQTFGPGQVAIGDNATTFGQGEVAIGSNTQTNGSGNVAIGDGAKTSTFGGINGVALGKGADVSSDGSVALGSGSIADGSTLGTAAYQPLDIDGNPIAVAAPTADSEASVGSAGDERRITNVAAGATDTDAVNVSQLKAVNEQATTPLTFAGDAGTGFDRKLGEQVNIVGGADASGNTNITTQGDGTDTLEIVMTDQPQFGDITVNTGGGATINELSNLTFDPNNFTSGQAATEDQLKLVSDVANTGWDVQTNGDASSNVAPGDTVQFLNGQNIEITRNDKDITVATADNVIFTDVQTDTLTAGPVSIDAAGIDAGNTSISNVAPGALGTDAVNVDQLDAAAAASKTEVTGGTNIASVNQTTGADGQDIYEIDANGASVSAGDGVDVTPAGPDANNVTDYAVALNQATKDSLGLADTSLQEVVTQIDGTAVKTIDQNDNVANFVTGQNIALSDDGAGGIEIATVDSPQFGNVTINTANGDTINNLSNTTFDPDNFTSGQAASEDQLKQVSDIANTGWDVQTNGDAATNVAPGDTVQFLDGKNIDITRNGTDITVATADDVNFDSINITNGPTLNDNGIDMGGDTITNLGDPINNTDAANRQYVDDNRVRYYSVNDVPTNQANFNNDGATGANAMAAGVAASATEDNATAVGTSAAATGSGSTAIGYASKAQGANSFALGENATSAAENSLAMGADSTANTRFSTAIGRATNAQGQGSIALGGGTAADAANATGTGAIAIGGYGAAGRGGANANQNYAVALGSGAQAAASEGDVALGSGSQTAAASPVSQATVGSTTYGGFAGSAPTSVVSVGSAGAERQITNVAAGRITNTSTDAINGSQLFSVIDTGFNIAADNGADDTVRLGETVNYTNDDGNLVATVRDNEIVYDLADTIDVDTINITNGPTLNDSGIDMGGDTITNLGDPVNQGDALNLRYFDENRTRYYSVNDGGTIGSNFNNDGATGLNAIASGVDASASGDGAVAMGFGASAPIRDSLALGSGSVVDRALAPDSGFIPAGSATIEFNTTDKELLGAISVGDNDSYRQITNVADGTQAQDAVTVRQLQGAVGSVVESGTKYFRANSTQPDAAAVGEDSIAVGPTTVTNGDNGIGMGNGAIVGQMAPGGTAIGNNAEVLLSDGMALGTNARSEAQQGIALGAGATVSHDQSVALGSNSTTEEAVGTSSVTIAGDTYTFAGTTPDSTVSVGSAGNERTLTNVAAGRVNETSTDAINGSQLFASNQAIEEVSKVANTGWNVQANGDTATNVAPGDTVQFLDGKNIAITRNGTDITVATADDVDFDSVTITNGPTLNDNGIDMGGDTITNLGDPVNNTDAANKQYVDQTETDLINLGMSFTGNDATAGDVQRNLGETLAITGEATAAGTYSGTNLRTVTDPASGAIKLEMADSPQFGNVTINEGGGDTINNLSNTTFDPDNFTSGQAASEDQLKQVSDIANTGWDVQTNGDVATNVAPGDTVQFLDGKNVDITRNGTDITVATADDVDFDSVTITNGPTLNDNGINMNGDTITNLGDPVNNTDAANKQYVDQTETDLINLGMSFTGNDATAGDVQRNLGETLAITGEATAAGTYSGTNLRTVTDPASGAIKLEMADSPQFGNVTINEGGGDTINNLSNTTFDPDNFTSGQAASEDQLKQVSDIANTGWDVQTNGDVATNVAPGDTVQFLDGKNVDITRNGTDITVATADDVDFDSVNITDGPTLNDNGIDMDGDTITNLGDPVNEGDALNLRYFDANRTRYYSVNDGGTIGGNFNNDGATGLNAIASGVDAIASGDGAVAMGFGASAPIRDSLALGSGSVVDRALAPVSGFIPANGATIEFNTTDKELLGAISVGDNDSYRQITNVADGTQAQDAVTVRQLQGAVGSVVESGTKYFRANSTQPDSAAVGEDSIAVGPTTVTNGDNGIGMGNGAIVGQMAPGGTAIGNNAEVLLSDGMALGTNARSEAQQGIALGAGATVSHDQSVALGSNSTTDEAVGTADVTLAGTTYNFAGTTPDSTVSVGSAGNERTLTNVAAGRVSETSTDAINGSQLFASNQAIEEVSKVANTGWNVQANGDTATNVAPGDTVQFLDGSNVEITRNGADISVAMVDSPQFGNVTINTAGNDTINNLSNTTFDPDNFTSGQAASEDQLKQVSDVANAGWNLTANGEATGENIAPGETVDFTEGDNIAITRTGNSIEVATTPTLTADSLTINGGPVINNAGINMGGNVITNLGDGVADGDAVNVSQLKAAETEVAAGTNVANVVETTGTDGQSIYTVNADGTTVSAGSNAVAITPTGPDGNNVTDYAVDLSQDSKDSLILADTALQEVVTQIDGTAVKTIDQNDNVANFVTGQNIALSDDGAGGIEIATVDSPQFGNVTVNTAGNDTINNLSNTTFDPDNFTSGQAASEDQLKQVSDIANTGWDVQTNGDVATNVAPGDTVQFLDGKNVDITRNGTDITVATADDVDFDSVTITNGPTLNDSGIDMGGDTITSLGDPVNEGDALNLRYFDANRTRYYSVNDGGIIGGNFNNDGATGLNAIASGVNVTASGDGAVAMGFGASAPIRDSLALGSGSVVDRALAPVSGFIPANGATIEFNTTDKELLGAISVGDNDSYRQITNVADGTEAQDAVTVRQLQGAVGSVVESGTKYFRANSTQPDAAAVGEDSIAVGPTTVTNGDNGIGMGNGAIVGQMAPGGTAIGNNAEVLLSDGMALGTNARSEAQQGIALGAGATVSHDQSVALGSNSTTEEAVGTSDVTIAGDTYTFAGTTPDSTVSVGSAGNERTLTNVAAGRVSETSTDAINGSQLFASNQAIEEVSKVANTGWNVQANGDTATNVAPGDTVQFLDGSNVEITRNGADISVAMVASPQFGNVTVNTAGNDTINNLSNTTFDPDNFTSGQAASEDQLKQVSDVANAGWNLTANGEATGENIAPGETADFTEGDNIAITRTGNSIEVATTPTLTADSLTINGGPVINNAGINMNGDTITNLGDPVNNTDAANKQYVDQAEIDLINLGMSFTGNDATAGDVQRNLGETLAITGEATAAGTYSGTNLRTVTDPASGAIKLEMADSPQFGNVTINEGGGDTINNLSNTTFDPDNFTSGQAASEDQLKQVSDIANTGWDVQTNGDVATNVAPGDTVQFLDGKNIDITRNGTDITVATADDVDFDSVTITNGPSLNDNGINMGGDTITSLGDPVNEGDALNLRYFDANRTRYYSVNDGGIIGGNFNNDGATGLNAIASGVDASASGNGAVAMGFGASAPIRDSLALGSGSVVDRALAPVSGFIPANGATIEFNTTDKELLGAISVGDNDSYRQITNVADGTQAQDAVTVRQLQGAVGSVVESGTKYFRANSTQPDAAAVGEDSIAVGPTTVTNGDNGIGMGNGAIVGQMAPGGTAIGNNAEVLLSDGMALGTNARSEAQQGIALGAGATVSHDQSVALGSNSTTDEAVGTADITLAGTTYNFAGTTPDSTVSVGSAGNERTLTNVAAGRVSETSTDAINGSQLFASNQAIEEVSKVANTGWNLSTQDQSAENIAPNGEVNLRNEDGNLSITQATSNGREEVTFALASDITIDNSLTVGADGPEISETGITNLAPGEISEQSTDAINGSQLYETNEWLQNLDNSVTNIVGDVANGQGIRYVRTNDDGLPLSDAFAQAQGSTAVGYEAEASADRSLALGYQAMAAHQGSIALGEGARTDEAVGTATIEIGGETYTFAGISPLATVSVGSPGAERTMTNVAAGRINANSTDAINGSQLYITNQVLEGLNNRVNSIETNVADINTQIEEGDILAGGEGIQYNKNDDGETDPSSITLEGDGGTTITNVANGKLSPDSSDAVTGGQLYQTNTQTASNTTNIASNSDKIAGNTTQIAGNSVKIDENAGNIASNTAQINTNTDSIADLGETVDKGLNFGADEGDVVNRQLGDTVAITGDDNITTRTTGDGVQVTLNNELAVDSITTGNTTMDNSGVRIEGGPSMTQGGIDMNGTRLSNLAPGEADGDAVNMSQMRALGQQFQGEINNVNNRLDSVERDANAGTASALAASSVPQAWRSGESMIAVGAGTYGGESAVSVGVSRLSDNGRWIIQGKVTGDSQNNFGAGVGAGWHW
ncbi:YadA-like family protein [Halomonas sp. LS-001]